jgi:Zn-dependent alcohol dehydrogenase
MLLEEIGAKYNLLLVFFAQTSFASHAIANASNVVKVSRDLPLELLGPLGCGFQTGAAKASSRSTA